MRIVSLLPSATEIVCQLGLLDSLVGVTHECDYPEGVADLPKVTRTRIPRDASSRQIDDIVRASLQTQPSLYWLDVELFKQLRPDLVVTQTLCEVCAVPEAEVSTAVGCLPRPPRVVDLRPTCLADLFGSIRQVAAATATERRAEEEIHTLQARIRAVADCCAGVASRPRVVLLEWLDPLFSCGHWNPELVWLAGGREMIGVQGQPSRKVQWQEVIDAQPEVLVVACCGLTIERTLGELPVLQSNARWQELPCMRDGRVYVADGSTYFNRPGPRLVDSLEILAHAVHPDVFPLSLDGSLARIV
jgi:iron complex transport system substrate-binding protein